MNNIVNYLAFYSGENRKQIFNLFYNFSKYWRDNDMVKMASLLTDNCILDISMTGHFQGKKFLSQALSWPGQNMDIRILNFSNFVCRSHNGIAQQSAYTQHKYAVKDNDEMTVHPFIFGGQFCNTLEKVNGTWLFSHIRFDLMYEYGNNSFVKDNWNLIDYTKFYGHQPMINPEIESPWRHIPVDDEPQSDEEQVFELEFKNNFGMDGGDFSLCHEVFSDDIFLDYTSHKNMNKSDPLSIDGTYSGRKEAVNFFKSKQHKEARLQHTTSMAEIQIEGNTARAYMIRSEFNRIKNFIYNAETIFHHPLTAIHVIDAQKENGLWKMKEMRYYPIIHLVSTSPSGLCFDEMLCLNKHWKNLKKELHI
ncbi:nuclear transport factor 2 family protein [Enterococcus hulanensis]|uniref:nuclear transport factor 2 family protein n=1 Tax=Enterococcus hulanensis TaxID=2559929 RepID=UPI0014852FB4|nr:nuclear transport factor 2 family protein [Enterococcus hulanensis]MDT2659223.1 nuclear transport factor 2 family protein [Enterococcus hulanensis]